MHQTTHTVKHRDSKLRAQVKWLEDADYFQFLEASHQMEEAISYRSKEVNKVLTSHVKSEPKVDKIEVQKKKRIKEEPSEETPTYMESKSESISSDISDSKSVSKQKRKNIPPAPKTKNIKVDIHKFMTFLNKWSGKLPILQEFNSGVRNNVVNNSIEAPKLALSQEDGDCVIDVKFKLGSTFNYLTCKLCKGLFVNAHTIKECLHTFCKSCIVLYSILVGQQCPVCLERFTSTLEDSIEYDNCIQSLVDKLFPLSEPDEDRKDVRLGEEQFSVESFESYLTEQSEEAIEIETKLFNSDEEIGGPVSNLRACLTLRPVESGRWPKYYIAVEKEMFISELYDYLLLKLELYNRSTVTIYLGKEILPSNHSIEFICKSRRIDMAKNIELKYSIKGGI